MQFTRSHIAPSLLMSAIFFCGATASEAQEGAAPAAATEAPATGETNPEAKVETKADATGDTPTRVDAASSPEVTFDALPALPTAPTAPTTGEPTATTTQTPPAASGKKPRMLVMDLVDQGAGKEVTSALTAAMNQQAIKSYNGIVTTAEEIRLTLTVNAQQTLLGCYEPRCMADVGKTIEADIVLGGNVAKVGEDIVITLISTNARSGERMGTEQRKVPLHKDLYFYAAQQLTSLVITGKAISSRVPVRINASESAAEILVDGRALGYAPLTIELDPGTHEVRIAQDGFVPWQSTITVIDGLPLEVNATLSTTSIALWPVATGAAVVSVIFLGMAAIALELAYENYSGGLGLGDAAHDGAWPILVDLIPRSEDSYRNVKEFNAAELATLQSRTNTQTAIAAGFGSVAGVFALSAAALLTADLIME